ncbi:multicopper oxidase family protein [Amycolatopsis taiwanensis]|uniref:multicopper oxidase family protein n=1 Tax=Amycolatopsis taiwanensis TaxID=342230 RepID=UPI0004847AFA|nr:multicopper oxidase family protein [Amycolatopsis taiwanensis]
MLNRRRALTLGGVAVGSALMSAYSGISGTSEASAMAGMDSPPPTAGPKPKITPFAVRMPVPPTQRPVAVGDGMDVYHQTIRVVDEEMLPGLRTSVYTYGSGFVGPTIRARSGRPVIVRRTNRLPVRTNTHLHGGHVPADSDGHPMALMEPGESRTYCYPNEQPGATLWYHDHAHVLEAEGVYRGLHGFYLLESEDERYLGLPSGYYDIPIMLTDAHFDANGKMIFITDDGGGRKTLLANGRPQPYFPVAARRYRFRLLNGSNMRIFRLNLGGQVMTQIGSDGGLLPEPVEQTEFVLAPAERIEIVIDFARYRRGTKLVLADGDRPVLRFDVQWEEEDYSRVPDTLRPLPRLFDGPTDRQITFTSNLKEHKFFIDGKTYDANRIDAWVERNSTEIWRITNADAAGFQHSMHLHLVQFRVLDRDGAPPWPGESGLKDTVLVPPNTSVRIKIPFDGYRGVYVYHCHMLDHSAFGGMMAQFQVTDYLNESNER